MASSGSSVSQKLSSLPLAVMLLLVLRLLLLRQRSQGASAAGRENASVTGSGFGRGSVHLGAEQAKACHSRFAGAIASKYSQYINPIM